MKANIFPEYNSNKYLRFTIQHQNSLTFSWDLTRPETGDLVFSRNCAFCSQDLHIKVFGLERIAAYKKRAPKTKIIGVLTIVFGILASIGSVIGMIVDPLNLGTILFLLLFISLFGIGIGIMIISKASEWSEGLGYQAEEELTSKYHCIKNVESRSDFPF